MYSRIHISIRHPVFVIRIVFVTWCICSSPSNHNYHRLGSRRFDESLVHSTEYSCGDSVFVLVFGCFSPIKNVLGRTEMRTRERKEWHWQSIWTFCDIYRDDRVRIATCSLRMTPDRQTDLKTGYIEFAWKEYYADAIHSAKLLTWRVNNSWPAGLTIAECLTPAIANSI